jgi:cobyrinic acid a,c-diamide synthase
MYRFLISAAHKSSGKTTLSVGLCAALRQRGLAVQPFKKGPDYIDPMWLGAASGRSCFNLDPYLMQREEIVALFQRASGGADISLVEGNKGLYDGLALDGSNSNAALAHMLGLPVVLVIDARGMTRGIAPLILGYQAFDRGIRIAGVILNNLGGARHEAKLRAVVEHYTDVPVLGAVAHDERLRLVERHLGLMPSNEADGAHRVIEEIGATIAGQVDLRALIDVAAGAPVWTEDPGEGGRVRGRPESGARVRIGVARDRAFGFYYPDDLEALEAAGAEIVPLDTLHDSRLPDIDGLIIGGGFPEMFIDELNANAALRNEIRAAAGSGMPIYAECGGLMYLARSITWRGATRAMAGVIPGEVVMHDRPVGRGYVRLQEAADHPWPRFSDGPATGIRGHEFHYSSLENLDRDVEFAYKVERGHGVDGRCDGIVYRNVLASYAHLRGVGGNDWPARFVEFVRRAKWPAADSCDAAFPGARGEPAPAESAPVAG